MIITKQFAFFCALFSKHSTLEALQAILLIITVSHTWTIWVCSQCLLVECKCPFIIPLVEWDTCFAYKNINALNIRHLSWSNSYEKVRNVWFLPRRAGMLFPDWKKLKNISYILPILQCELKNVISWWDSSRGFWQDIVHWSTIIFALIRKCSHTCARTKLNCASACSILSPSRRQKYALPRRWFC